MANIKSPKPEYNETDKKWIEAIRPYWGSGMVPYWVNGDGSIDAQKTVDWLMRLRNQKKIGPNGEELEFPSISSLSQMSDEGTRILTGNTKWELMR